MLSFALTHCTPDVIESLINVRSLLETQVNLVSFLLLIFQGHCLGRPVRAKNTIQQEDNETKINVYEFYCKLCSDTVGNLPIYEPVIKEADILNKRGNVPLSLCDKPSQHF